MTPGRGDRREYFHVPPGLRDRTPKQRARLQDVRDVDGAALDLPDPILQLSLFRHLGQPMGGVYDPVGIVIASVLVVGGLATGAWGLRRRDVDR